MEDLKQYTIAWVVAMILTFVFILSAHAKEVDTTKAVIHHTATAWETSVASIKYYHINERGWDDIGYHFLIKYDGTICEGRPITKKGAHKKGKNHYLGIALIGEDEFTDMQIESLIKLLKRFEVTHIERHHEKCPGVGLDVGKIREGIK